MKRVYEVGYECKESGEWHINWCSVSLTARNAQDAIKKADRIAKRINNGLLIRMQDIKLVRTLDE